jgi:hypothetical protein
MGAGHTAAGMLGFRDALTENHRRCMLKKSMPHDNAGRPYKALGPGIPQLPPHLSVPLQAHRHGLPEHLRVMAHSILGGLHHDDRLEKKAA